jgi:hypothetical protein
MSLVKRCCWRFGNRAIAALQALPVDHEEQGQQHHRQHRGGQPRCTGQHAVRVVELGADHLHLAVAVTAGHAGEVLRRLVGLLHRLGQVLHLAGDLAQLLRCFLRPFHRRADQLHRQRTGHAQTGAEDQQCAQRTRGIHSFCSRRRIGCRPARRTSPAAPAG